MNTCSATIRRAVLVLLVSAGGAEAAAPKPVKPLVVPGKSMGGVKLGAALASGAKAWRSKPAFCTEVEGSGQCTWSAARFESAFFTSSPDVGIDTIVLSCESCKDRRASKGLAQFKTRKGIGLNATVKAFRKAYPKAKGSVRGGNGSLRLTGPRGASTTFTFVKGRVGGLQIRTKARTI